MGTEPAETYEAATPPRRSTRPLLLACLVLASAAVGGAAGAFGLLAPIHALVSDRKAAAPSVPLFYALPEFRIAIGGTTDDQPSIAPGFGRHLRAVVQLEVEAVRMPDVDALQPRIVDTLLSFLHAIDQRDVGSVRNLDRLKAQMLHRVRQVTGDDAVRGVLITELALL
jgi:flagellar basal body-associated protein FliL